MSVDLNALRATGIGSWPGADIAEAIKITLAELPELPYLPELPARGPHAGLVGRGTAFLTGLGVELRAAEWRLSNTSGRDHRRALATLRADLDELEEQTQGYVGSVKIAVAGPWTLAASIEHPRGDKVLPDVGARRDLAQSLTEGVATLVTELIGRLPDIAWVIQLDEPLLPGVLAGAVRTASGLSQHRAVDLPEVSASFSGLVERLSAVDVPVWVHCCAPGLPVTVLHRAGVAAILVDLDQLSSRDLDAIGPAMDDGLVLGAGALPTGWSIGPDQVAERALGTLRAMDLDPLVTSRSMITPSCGLAGATRNQAVRALRTVRTAAGIVSERLAD